MIGVTGANGYLGGRIRAHLRGLGIEAIALVRAPVPGDEGTRRYALAEPLEDSVLDGLQTVIHAAHDLAQRGAGVRAVNFCGSLPLLDGMAARGGRVVLISSLSAFAGARSDYGRTRLELEHAVLQRGGIVLRPGLAFGAAAGGLFGAMVAALSRHALMPLIGSGSQRLFVTHDEHLCELVSAIVAGRFNANGPVFAAHETPTTLRGIAGAIAGGQGRRLVALPLPPALVGAVLRSGELAGVGLPFRSDSLRSLLHPIPLDQVSALARSSVDFPALTPELWLR
jgi:nucleoside-diphosphate-sugar epimerase